MEKNTPTKISSYLRTDPRVQASILRAMHTYRISNKDLIDIGEKCGITIHSSKLSIYLKHGGNKKNALTDESILLVLGILGIEITTRVNSKGLRKDNINEHFEYFFPKSKFPQYKNAPERLIEFYRSKGALES
jgi:hypothetical protein